MTIRERIHEKIDAVPEKNLADLLEVVQEFAREKVPAAQDGKTKCENETIFDKLLKIKIDGPRDFSENFEQYAIKRDSRL